MINHHSLALIAFVSLLSCTTPSLTSTNANPSLNVTSSTSPTTSPSSSPKVTSPIETASPSPAQAITTPIDIMLALDDLQEKYPNNFKALTSSQLDLIVKSLRPVDLDPQNQSPLAPTENTSNFQHTFPFLPKHYTLSESRPHQTLDAVPLFTSLNFSFSYPLDASLDPCLREDSFLVLEHNTFLEGTGTLFLTPYITNHSDDDSLIEVTNITGQVFDENNKSVSGVIVSLSIKKECEQVNLSARTDADGKYVFKAIPAGVKLELLASLANHITQSRTVFSKSNKRGDPKDNVFNFGGPDSPSTALK